MNVVLAYASLACVAAGIVTGAAVLAIGRRFREALRTAVEFWLAAGLLHLGLAPGWQPLLVAAVILVIRQMIGLSLARPAHPHNFGQDQG